MLVGCKNKESKEKYITITNTYSTDKEELVMDVLTYNFSSQSLLKIASIPYTSQYPLAMYNAVENKVYYTALSEDKKVMNYLL